MADQTGFAHEGRTVRPWEIREALEAAISEGRGIVVLEVRRPGREAVRARLSQMTWAALWDSLALDPEDNEPDALWPEGKDEAQQEEGR